MALISLKNGKVIDVDLFWYLNLSDEELQDLEAMDTGFEPDNPFYNSSLLGGSSDDDDDIDMEIDIPKIDET